MRIKTEYHRLRPKNFTSEEKRDYCLKWERSDKSKAAFCQSVGISKSTFSLWYAQFKKETLNDAAFSPVTLKASETLDPGNIMRLEICLPNQINLFVEMQASNLVFFIQELFHATAVIR